MINDAKKALAGLEIMAGIIDAINKRRPDIVAQAAEQVLGVKADVGDDEFDTILNKRAEGVTHFDKYADRIAEMEGLLRGMVREYEIMTRGEDGDDALVATCKKALSK